MDGKEPLFSELKDDHLEHVARPIGPDHQQLRRIFVGLEVHDHDSMLRGVDDVIVANTVSSPATEPTRSGTSTATRPSGIETVP